MEAPNSLSGTTEITIQIFDGKRNQALKDSIVIAGSNLSALQIMNLAVYFFEFIDGVNNDGWIKFLYQPTGSKEIGMSIQNLDVVSARIKARTETIPNQSSNESQGNNANTT